MSDTTSEVLVMGFAQTSIEAIREQRPFKDDWTIGYTTKGGTYVIASNGRQSDSGKPRDLVAILPSDLGHGRVIQLYLATNPDLIGFLESIVR